MLNSAGLVSVQTVGRSEIYRAQPGSLAECVGEFSSAAAHESDQT